MRLIGKTKLSLALATLVIVLLAAVAPSLGSTVYTVTDGNSTVLVDPSSSSGAYSWTADGREFLYQEWFWYRVGSDTTALPISTLTLTSVTQPDPGHLDLIYSGTGFNISIDYTLKGGQPGSGVSDLGETIAINHTGTSTLDFHFFEYSDFDLGGFGSQDKGFFSSRNDVYQYYPDAQNLKVLHETTATTSNSPPSIGQYPSHWEMGYYYDLLGNLETVAGYNLSDNPAIGTEIGPLDLAWAFQWDRVFDSNGSMTISKNKGLSFVPIPPSTLLLGTGLMGLVGLGYRRRKS
jgi:hypothetical protein